MASTAPEGLARAHIKGAAFREFLRFYAARHGDAELRKRAAEIPASRRGDFELGAPVLGVLTSNWYDARDVHRLLEALTAGMSDAERKKLALEASRAVMDATLHGLYRVLFDWMATPERYAKYAPKLWRTYYDSGSFLVEPGAKPTEAVSTVRDWPAHHPFICELNRGAAIAIYEALGCKKVECERVACVAQGERECRFVTRWSE